MAFSRLKNGAHFFNKLSTNRLQKCARFRFLKATRQLVAKIARKWALQKSECKTKEAKDVQSVKRIKD